MTTQALVSGPARAPRRPPAEPPAVLRCAWHLAVLTGPGAGRCLGLEPGTALVGRTDVLGDPLVSARHLEVRLRRGRVEARDAGSANGTRLRRAALRWLGTSLRPPWGRARRPWAARHGRPGRGRRLGTRWRALSEGDVLEIGSTHLQLRPRPVEAARPASDGADRRARSGRDTGRLLLPGLMAVTTVPMVISSSAGPWRWLLLLVPVALLWSAVRAGRGSEPPGPLPDPGAVLLLAGAGPGTTDVSGRPAQLDVSVDPGGARRPRRGPAPLDLTGGPVALVGPPAVVEAVAGWLVCQLAAHHRPGELALDLPASWRWASRLPHRTAAAGPSGGSAGPEEGTARLRVAVARPDLVAAPGLVLAADVAAIPPWCSRVVHLPRTPPGLPGPSWCVAVADALTGGPRAAAPPRLALLADLLGLRAGGPDVVATADRLAAAWDRGLPGLAAPVGVGAEGVVELDLALDGPHALVAGSTGSGKSELLLSWLTALAVRCSPATLQVVLVDYKGGATFAPLAGLPHTAGVLTDLDPAGTERALSSLRAEVRRREALLAGAGAPDIASYTAAGHRLARLLVVVDEFRVLAEAHPEVLSALVRLAAQGRSLGLHLVLATQRPGGAVGPEIRANLGVRVCLRVLEPADSVEVVGTPRAAGLDGPGRALLRTDRVRELQVAWAGPPGQGLVREVVAGAALAWERRGPAAATAPPWAPPLPAVVSLDEIARPGGPAGPPPAARAAPVAAAAPPRPVRAPLALPLARTDLPDEQRLGTWSWSGPALLVTGGPGTGRTQALRTVAASASAAGVPVHVVAGDPAAFADVHDRAAGSLVPAGDPRLVARLLDLLGDAVDGTQVLLVDDADDVAENLDLTGPGRGPALLGAAVRGARRNGVAVALAGPPTLAGARWLEAVRTRVVLSPRDETEALLSGVPAALRLRGGPPGRGVLVRPEGAVLLQVALAGPGARPATAPWELPAGVPLLRPLPGVVRLSDAPVGLGVVLGRGGDDAGWVTLGCAPGERVLVVGPPGSGRTTALEVLARQLRRAGRTVAADAARARPGDVVVLDDLDPLAALPDLTAVTVLAAARTEAAATTLRGPLATWRGRADLVLLRPGHPLAGQVTDVDVRGALDPVRPRHAGLAVLVRGGRAIPVQVATP
ncbi:FtsK/SpoIIIE domain-containing protein [Georgenia muralis]